MQPTDSTRQPWEAPAVIDIDLKGNTHTGTNTFSSETTFPSDTTFKYPVS